MDNYDEIYNSICRVCLSHSSYQNMVNLFDEKSPDGISSYGKYVTTFANILLETNDNLPTMMCRNCLLLLKQAIIFKHTCESSDLQLKNLMEYNDSTTKDIKENICEYTIFKHYFPEECVSEAFGRVTDNRSNILTRKYNRGVETKHVRNKPNLKPPLIEDDDDICNQDYDNDLNANQNTCDTDTESKSDTSEAKPEYLFLDDLEKVINARLDGNMQDTQTCKMGFVRSFHRKKVFQCNICNKLLTNITYDRHMQRHNGCRFMCESCGKAYPTIDELNVHQVISHGYGPHLTCNFCDYKAPRKINLIEHIRLHTGERPFTCETCGMTFRRKAIWKKHLIYHNDKTFQCPHCPKKFYHHYPLTVHMNNIHERLYVYKCNECSVTYASSKYVRKHLTQKHGIPRKNQGKILRIMKGATTKSTN